MVALRSPARDAQALRIKNFRSLGDVSVELGPVTAFVGANGSGKSNVLDAVQLFSDVMHLGLEGAITTRTGMQAVRRFQESGHPYDVSLTAEVADETMTASYSFTLKGDNAGEYRVGSERAHVALRGSDVVHAFEIEAGRWKAGPSDARPRVAPTALVLPILAGDERFKRLGDALRSMSVYAIYPDALRHPQKYDPIKPMNKVGSNWVSILRDQPEETWHADLVAALHKLSGDIVGVRVKPVGQYLTAQFLHAPNAPGDGGKARKHRKQKWFDAYQESDGTLRVAGMVSALLQQPPPSVVAIEEPELTVHPGALPMLVDYMREASLRSQIILTTHSPEVLDLLEVDEMRVVTRRAGASMVRALAEPDRAVVREGLMTLGEIMRGETAQTDLLFDA